MIWMVDREDWPKESRLERTAGCGTVTLLVQASHEDAESALAAYADALSATPAARGHVVILAGRERLSPRVARTLANLRFTEVHFVQDQHEALAFGVVNGLGLFCFDAWGRLRWQRQSVDEPAREPASSWGFV